MTTFGDQVYQYGGVPVNGAHRTGKTWFVNPYYGSDGNRGRKPTEAKASLSGVFTKVNDANNDVVYLIGSGTSWPAQSTRIASTLTISQDQVSVIGMNNGGLLSMWPPIGAQAAATGVAPMITVSGSHNFFANLQIFHGINDATSLGCLQVTGERNRFYRCQISGCGNSTMDAAGQYSLKVTGGENIFEECYIGLDTVARDGTNGWAELIVGPGPRNIFKNCIFATYASGAGHHFVQTVQSLDRFTLFDNCLFYNADQMSTVTELTEAFDMVATTEHQIILKDSMLVGGADWDASSADRISVNMPAPAANGDGGYSEDVD